MSSLSTTLIPCDRVLEAGLREWLRVDMGAAACGSALRRVDNLVSAGGPRPADLRAGGRRRGGSAARRRCPVEPRSARAARPRPHGSGRRRVGADGGLAAPHLLSNAVTGRSLFSAAGMGGKNGVFDSTLIESPRVYQNCISARRGG